MAVPSITEIMNERLPALIFAYARKKLGIIDAFSHDYSTQPAQKGAILPWGVARGVAVTDVTPGPYRAGPSQLSVDAQGISLSNYKAVYMTFTDSNQMYQQIEAVESPIIEEAGNAIADYLSQSAWQAIAAAYPQNYQGTIGAAFNYAFLQSLSNAADQARFGAGRSLIAGTYNIQDMGADDVLKHWFAFQNQTGMYERGIPKQVMDWNVFIDINQPAVKAVGTQVGLQLNAGYLAGVTTIVTKVGASNSGTVLVGDLITIANTSTPIDPYVYQVTAVQGSSPDYTLTLSTPATSASSTAGSSANAPYGGPGGTVPFTVGNGGLQVAHAASDIITTLAVRGNNAGAPTNTLAVNGQGPVAIDPRGCMSAMRMPPVEVLGEAMLAAPAYTSDKVTGMPLAIAVYKEFHQITFELSIVQGFGIRSELVIPVLR